MGEEVISRSGHPLLLLVVRLGCVLRVDLALPVSLDDAALIASKAIAVRASVSVAIKGAMRNGAAY